ERGRRGQRGGGQGSQHGEQAKAVQRMVDLLGGGGDDHGTAGGATAADGGERGGVDADRLAVQRAVLIAGVAASDHVRGERVGGQRPCAQRQRAGQDGAAL